jgi:hypothetical protein
MLRVFLKEIDLYSWLSISSACLLLIFHFNFDEIESTFYIYKIEVYIKIIIRALNNKNVNEFIAATKTSQVYYITLEKGIFN